MRFTLVGNRKGRRAVVWSSVLKIALIIVPIPAIAVPLISLAVRKLWDTTLVLYGAAAGVAIVILLVIAAACTEMRRLPVLHDNRPPSD
jgi:uncharacterized membrane protein YcjF (UPF0283 family)